MMQRLHWIKRVRNKQNLFEILIKIDCVSKETQQIAINLGLKPVVSSLWVGYNKVSYSTLFSKYGSLRLRCLLLFLELENVGEWCFFFFGNVFFKMNFDLYLYFMRLFYYNKLYMFSKGRVYFFFNFFKFFFRNFINGYIQSVKKNI